MGTAPTTTWDYSDLQALYELAPSAVSEAQITPFTEDEIRSALKSMDKNSAPGPDGSGAGFYQAVWEEVKTELITLAEQDNW